VSFYDYPLTFFDQANSDAGELRVRGGRVETASFNMGDVSKYTIAMDSMQPEVLTIAG
jgi:hypothetical protein